MLFVDVISSDPQLAQRAVGCEDFGDGVAATHLLQHHCLELLKHMRKNYQISNVKNALKSNQNTTKIMAFTNLHLAEVVVRNVEDLQGFVRVQAATDPGAVLVVDVALAHVQFTQCTVRYLCESMQQTQEIQRQTYYLRGLNGKTDYFAPQHYL